MNPSRSIFRRTKPPKPATSPDAPDATPANSDEPFVDYDAAIAFLGVSRSTIKRAIADGLLRSYKLRGQRLFLLSELREDITSGRAASDQDDDQDDDEPEGGEQ